MMRSHELARLLLERPDVELILQKDAEGNGYSPLRGVDFEVVYVPETTYYGEAYHREWTAEDVLMDEEEWTSLKEKNSDYAILFPVN